MAQQSDVIKYEMTYVNGGFTEEGIKIEPTPDGKLSMSISIYGGGKKKNMVISSKSGKLSKLTKAYSLAQTQGDAKNGDDVTSELEDITSSLKSEIAYEIVELLKKLDNDVKKIINSKIKEIVKFK